MSVEQAQKHDPIALRLREYAQNILVVIFGLLPLIFIPTAIAPFEYTKVLVVILGLFASLVLYSLSVLRSGVITVGISYPLCAMWVTALIAIISSLLSGDLMDSLVGDFFSVHAALFVALLAFVPTVWMTLRPSKSAVMKLYVLLAASTAVLVIFHVLRIVFGADFLSLGVFSSAISTPVGSWNDLALLLGLTIILSLVVLEQLTLTKVGRALFLVVIILSLGMLSIINFFTVWLVLGLSSLVLVVYVLGKDRFSSGQLPLSGVEQSGSTSLPQALLVFLMSVLFVVGGSVIGGWISEKTQISYVEVRPSLEATSNIARNVYTENAILGIGANKFSDAWRLYKEESINTTPFWNTDFNAGNGYVTTFFVTTGVLGGLAWFMFLGLYVVTGVRRLLNIGAGDKVWYFVGVSSFVSAVYIWGMSVIYVPGVVILLLGALCTGVSLHAFGVLRGDVQKEISMGGNRQMGFMLTLAVIVIIVASVSALYVATRHYLSVYTFNESVQLMQEGKSISESEKQVLDAFTLASNDIFARRIAEYQLERLNALAGNEKLDEAQTKEFETAMVNGIRFAQEATNIDSLEPANWAVLGSIYNVLASLNIEGSLERVREALTKSRELNPKNPLPYLETAIVEARAGNYAEARLYIEKSIALKQNFTEAYYLLSQLAVIEGNVEEAIRSTRSVIALEPDNPVRYYQLGVLESSRNDITAAISAFEKAVSIDQNYANARYLLALAYDSKGESAKAKEQLVAVLALNPGNTEITELIQVISTEGSLKRLRSQVSNTVQEVDATTDQVGSVSTKQGDTETSLVSPVNTPPKEDAQSSNE